MRKTTSLNSNDSYYLDDSGVRSYQATPPDQTTPVKLKAEMLDLYLANRSALRVAALKILGNPERADGVVQDAYFKLAEVSGVLDIRQPLAYLFQTVRNLALDRHRRTVLETGLFAAEEEGGDVPAPAATPEAIAIGRQDLQRVAAALGELPERTRRAFELYRIGGWTQRDIAEELGVSATLVNFMIRDTLAHCRAALNGC